MVKRVIKAEEAQKMLSKLTADKAKVEHMEKIKAKLTTPLENTAVLKDAASVLNHGIERIKQAVARPGLDVKGTFSAMREQGLQHEQSQQSSEDVAPTKSFR